MTNRLVAMAAAPTTGVCCATSDAMTSDAVREAPAFMESSVISTRANPPAPRPVARSSPTLACRHTVALKHANVGVISPVARPRMTLIALWFPAFPPAPTSIVRKSVMTMFSRTRTS
eukprot:30886-Pelagococcus_subviridis.AAC.10